MNIILNGKSTESQSRDVQALLKEQNKDLDAGGLAVAVNETVIPKKKWKDQPLKEGDRVEIIQATQGG